MTSTTALFQVVDAPESTGVAAPTAAEAASAGSFGSFLSALVNATDEMSDFYSNYMISQANIAEDQSSSSIATSKAQVTATNKEIQEQKHYEKKLHHASALSKLIKAFAITASVLIVCVTAATGVGVAGGVALALAVFSLIMATLPAEDNPLMMLGNQIAKGVGDRAAGQWIGLGLQVAVSIGAMGIGGVFRAAATTATTVADSAATLAAQGLSEEVATQFAENFATALPKILAAMKNTALLLEIGTAATSMTAATYTLEAANIMKNKIAPLQGDISLFTAFSQLIQTQQSQQSDSQSAMDSSFSELFTEQVQLAEMYGAAYGTLA